MEEKKRYVNGRVWKAGTGTLVLTFSKSDCKMYNIDEGDYVAVEIKDIYKRKDIDAVGEKATEKRKEKELNEEKKKFIVG